MRILVHHQGQQLGPFTIEELRAALAAGKVSTQDLAWWEGAPSWVPVASVPGLGAGVPGGGAPVGQAPGDGSALAVWSLILGIPSLFPCGFFSGIPAVICGHLALARKARANVQKGKGLAVAGLVTGYLGTVVGTILILASIAIPVYGAAMEKARQTQSLSQARIIGVSLIEYASIHDGKYPATLEAMVKEGLLDAGRLADPAAPELGADGYQYIQPDPGDQSNPQDKAMLVGRKAFHGKRVVVFRDSSARIMPYSLPADL